jgi:cysteine desulfurase
MGIQKRTIYLDYHATTPVEQHVLEAMLPYFCEHFGNPASRSHSFGWQASEAVEIARDQVASLIHAEPRDVIFTSGSTEGLNMIIKGLAEALNQSGKHIVTLATEHSAVLDPLMWLEKKGFEVTRLPVLSDGVLDVDFLREAIRKDTIMVIVMWANNETGVIQDMKKIGAICKEKGVVLISDATQAAGKIEINPADWGVDVISFSAHKMYGPKGVGAVWFNPGNKKVKPVALIHGGGHERGLRSGTLNVPGIVGFGAAAKQYMDHAAEEYARIKTLRDDFEKRILSSVEEVQVNGSVASRLPTVTNLKVKGVDSQAVMSRFRAWLAISSGSACSSANPEPSHVLLAMGLTPAEAKGSFRISFGRPSTTAEMVEAARMLGEAIGEERAQSPVWQMFKQGIALS